MKNEILVIPDIHGRDFWKEPCREWEGKIVFLGDYHDPYPQQVSKNNSLENLKVLVNFYENNKSRVVCLLGNHDGNYLIKNGFADRVDYNNYNEVTSLLKKLDLKVAYCVNDILFSHAGVLPKWLKVNNLSIEDIPNLKFDHKALTDISPWRGGFSEVGGILWGDVREYASEDHIPNLYQVFGHTQMNKEIIQPDFACLDCRKCFIMNLDSKEIREY